MKYEWKQTIFTPEDLDGAGQYIIKEHKNKLEYSYFKDTSSLQSNMYKIGYINNHRLKEDMSNQYLIISMTDGWSMPGYHISIDEEGNKIEDSAKWEFISFSGNDNIEAKQKICEFLNNNIYKSTYRFATNEELIRVAAQQKLRTRS
jgi:hypothetical protein